MGHKCRKNVMGHPAQFSDDIGMVAAYPPIGNVVLVVRDIKQMNPHLIKARPGVHGIDEYSVDGELVPHL